MPQCPTALRHVWLDNAWRSLRTRSPAYAAEDQRQDEQDDEYDEQYLGDTRRAGGDPAETEHGGDDGDDEKYGGPVKHDNLHADQRMAGAVTRSALPIRPMQP